MIILNSEIVNGEINADYHVSGTGDEIITELGAAVANILYDACTSAEVRYTTALKLIDRVRDYAIDYLTDIW